MSVKTREMHHSNVPLRVPVTGYTVTDDSNYSTFGLAVERIAKPLVANAW